jgi:hypothetical protein
VLYIPNAPASSNFADWIAANVLTTTAYVDTIELFLPPHLNQATRDSIVASLHAYQCDDVCLQPSRGANGVLLGWRLGLNQPDPALFFDGLLDDLKDRLRATVARVDIAVDWMMRSQAADDDLQAFIERTGLLRFRRAGDMIVVGSDSSEPTIYWNKRKGRRRRRSRDLVLYTGNLAPCQVERCHLELRTYSTRACKRLGIVRASDLVNLDPAELFARYVGLCLDGVERYLAYSIRQQVRAARQIDPGIDGARLARQVRSIIEHNGHARAQWLKDHAPRWVKHTTPITAVLPIATRLWVDQLVVRASSSTPVTKYPTHPPIFENLNLFNARKFVGDFNYRTSRLLAGTLFGATETELLP